MLYRELIENNELMTLSQYACFSNNTKGRQHPIEPCSIRTEFMRDRDRIIHCKSFRRLKHKTQVFFSPEGDHYRTRLTHTLEVSQIARTIARALRLNEDLTEAAALGHDLGHTPFGHAGERVLSRLTDGVFCHNSHSLRVVDILDNEKGLNLTYEVRDGILNHTGENKANTLEGCIIKFADRIAYINHDIDDAVRGKIITNFDLPANVIKILGNTHGKRIDTMISDLVETSFNKNNISMSRDVGNATDELRSFMFERVYVDSLAKKEELKAEKILESLYLYFINNIDYLPKDKKCQIDRWGKQQIICDYLAGMTDRFALRVYEDIFIPKSWNL